MLSKVEDHEKLIAELAEHTARIDREEFQLPTLDSNLDLDDWESGTEGLESKTPQEICTLLGIRHGEPIPYFNRYIDTIGVRDPWGHKQLLDPNVEDENRTDLRAQWHQLVGIFKMLQQTFEGKSTLLMDAVGLGKTLQVVGVMALLAHYREVKKTTGQYPGYFSKCFIHLVSVHRNLP